MKTPDFLAEDLGLGLGYYITESHNTHVLSLCMIVYSYSVVSQAWIQGGLGGQMTPLSADQIS